MQFEPIPGVHTSEQLREQAMAALFTLTEREAGVIRMRFGLDDGVPKTLDEISVVFGVTRERIRQIESKMMAKIRHPARRTAHEKPTDVSL